MKLPDSLRDQLKIPLGVLLPIGQDNKRNIQKYLSDNSYIITVGDRTTEKMIDFDLIPSLQIIDGLEKRIKRDILKLGSAFELKIDNPPPLPFSLPNIYHVVLRLSQTVYTYFYIGTPFYHLGSPQGEPGVAMRFDLFYTYLMIIYLWHIPGTMIL